MKINNPLSLHIRCKELFIDYLFIVAYLIGLFIAATTLYAFIFHEIPHMAELQSQVIATTTSVLPIIVWFTVLDWKGGSIGKRKAGLTVYYETRVFWRSLLRNLIKFLPWQLAHIGIIGSMYSDWESPIALVLVCISMLLAIVLFVMGLFRKDKRHIGDMLAGTQVVLK